MMRHTTHILFAIDGGFQFYRTIIHMPCTYFSNDSVCCVWSNIYELSWQTVWCTHSSSYFCVYYHSCFASGAINDKTLMGAETGGFTSRYIILCIFTEFLSIKPLPCQETLHHSDTGRDGDKTLPLSLNFIKNKARVQCILHNMNIVLMYFVLLWLYHQCMNPCDTSTHIFQGWFTGTGTDNWLLQCQWSSPEGHG